LRLAIEFAVLEVLRCAQIVQRRLRFPVVETRQDITCFDRLALAAAALDDPAAHEWRRA